MCCFADAAVDLKRAYELAVPLPGARRRDVKALGMVADEVVDAGRDHFLDQDLLPLFKEYFRIRDISMCLVVLSMMERDSSRPDPNFQLWEMIERYGLQRAATGYMRDSTLL